MKINNINNSLRQAIFESFTNGFEFKSNEFKSMMLKLKATNYNEYYKLACNLYPVFYIMNEDRGFNIDELNDIMTEDLLESGFDDDEIEEQLNDLDDDNLVYVYDFSEVHTPQDLMDFLDKNEDALCEMLICTCLFHKYNYFYKRGALNRVIGLDKYFSKFNPTYYMDRLEYTHEIEINEFREIVDERVILSKDDIPIRFKRIGEAEDFLTDLDSTDPDNYDNLVAEISKDSYRYQKFLLLNNLVTNESDLMQSNIETIENHDMLESPYFLEINLDYYFLFHSKPKEFIDEVYKYFEENKEQYKIKVKTKEQN